MTIALTGGTGFIGSNTLDRFLCEGIKVRALYRPSPGRPGSLRQADGLEWIPGDIRDADVWRHLLHDCEAVIHLASTGVKQLEDTHNAVEFDFPALLSLMESAKMNGPKRVILAGSCFEYGATGDLISPRRLLENDSLRPTNGYGMAKALTSRIARSLAGAFGIDLVILRLFHVYGQNEAPTRLIPAVLAASAAGRPIKVTSGAQCRDFVHVRDVAQAFLQAAAMAWEPGFPPEGILLNISTGVSTTVRLLAETIADLTKRPTFSIQFGAVPHRPNEMWHLVGDCGLARNILGWEPRIKLEMGLSELNAFVSSASRCS